MAQTKSEPDDAAAGLPSRAALNACEIVALRARELLADAHRTSNDEHRDATGPVDTASAHTA
jgi:phytoene/squalene synthetase